MRIKIQPASKHNDIGQNGENGANELSHPLLISTSLHLVVLLLLFFGPAVRQGETWGGQGGGVTQVSLVGELQGVPLPRPDVVTDSKVATESPGWFREESESKPAPKAAPVEPATAEEIPDFQNNSRRRRADSIPPPPKRDRPSPKPIGAVPFGEGGPPALPFSNYASESGSVGSAVGSGNGFGSKYSWYVDAINRRISSNWLVSSVDPYVKWAPRTAVTFDILRDGSIVNLQMVKSSGITSVDRSTLRAVRESSPLPALPNQYGGDRVAVDFYFDFRRK